MNNSTTLKDVVKQTIDADIKELRSFRQQYLSQAALAVDTYNQPESEAYLHAALNIECCIQTLATIPYLQRGT